MTSNDLWYWTTPNKSWYDFFANTLGSPDISIWPESVDWQPSSYTWSSEHLRSCRNRQELKDRTMSLKSIFDGALYLFYDISRPIELRNLEFKDEENPLAKEVEPDNYDILVNPFCPEVLKKKIPRHINPFSSEVGLSIFLSRFDPVVRDILKFTGVNNFSYITLYAYTDWMDKLGWDDDRIAKAAGWSKSRLKDFKNTANNPTFLGPFSRHGGIADVPKRPMSLEDAKAGLTMAVKILFNERARKIGIVEKLRELR